MTGPVTKEPSPIPPAIQEELDRTGGLEGLVSRLPGNRELEDLAGIHQALSDLIRIKIIQLLSFQPLCVCVIREIIGISDSKLSYHLSALKKAGLIAGEQKGSWIIYSLTGKGKEYSIVKQDRGDTVLKSSPLCCNEPRKKKK